MSIIGVLMLFIQPFEISNIWPWIVVALAVAMLAGILAKCISLYLTLKRNRTYVKRDGNVIPLLAIRGEYFVLACGVEYSAGEDGQLKCGKYVVRGDGYDKFRIVLNGEERELSTDNEIELNEGDKLRAVTCDTLIKPN